MLVALEAGDRDECPLSVQKPGEAVAPLGVDEVCLASLQTLLEIEVTSGEDLST